MALVISPPDTSETTIGWPVLSIKYSTGNAPQQSFPAGTQIIFAMDLSWNITAGNAQSIYLYSGHAGDNMFAEVAIESGGLATSSSSRRIIKTTLLQDYPYYYDKNHLSLTVSIYAVSGSKLSGTLSWSNCRIIIGKPAKVTAGNIIYKTDFDAVGQLATVGNKITNASFSANNVIKASDWNTLWGAQ